MHTAAIIRPEPSVSKEILNARICDLRLQLEGSPVEKYVQRLYKELEQKGLKKFHPLFYLTDEWGCPSGEPIVGIPFYLAHTELAALEAQVNDLEDSREIMMYLRHEVGHAFNYAYGLHKTAEWRELFGPYRRSYRDNYRPVPFSKKFVRHMAGWYAQKHPDEDFAETFAVWLTPRSAWRKKYRGWAAMAKLRYVDRVARAVGNMEPVRRRGYTDITTDEMEMTVGEFYRLSDMQQVPIAEMALDPDLQDIFNVPKSRKNGVRPAHELVQQYRKHIIDKMAYWTGVQRPLLKKLVEIVEKRLAELGLRTDARRESEHLTEFTVYATALAMNYLMHGKFVHE